MWFWNFFLFGVLLLFSAYFYFNRNANYWKSRGISYKKPVFLFGNLWDILLGKISPGKYIGDLYHEFDSCQCFGMFALDQPWLVLRDPNLIKRVLVKDFQVFQNRFFLCNEKIDPITCGSLFVIKAPHWKSLRVKLTPMFSSGKMKVMLHYMIECAENLQNYVKTILGNDVEVKEVMAKYTTDVITSCAFGIAANSFANENSEFRKAGRRIFNRTPLENLQTLSYTFAPSLVKIFRYPFIAKEPSDFLHKAILETINNREEETVKRNDLIEVLIELKNKETKHDEFKFDNDRLVAQAVIFFTGGYETTSLTTSFTLYEICINSKIQDKLREEILKSIEKHGGVTYDAINDMKYLNMVISETLRKYPPIPVLFRECLESYKIPEIGLVIEKGTPVIIPLYGLHMDPKYFPNPEQYDPERFSEENKQNVTPYVYLPFGEGPRNCIAERFGLLSAKLSIIYILKSFKIEKSCSTKDSLVFASATLLQPKDGLRMTFRRL